MRSEFEASLEIEDGTLHVRGPIILDPGEAVPEDALMFVSWRIDQNGHTAAASGRSRADHWHVDCPGADPRLDSGPARATGVLVTLHADGRAESIPWQQDVVLRRG